MKVKTNIKYFAIIFLTLIALTGSVLVFIFNYIYSNDTRNYQSIINNKEEAQINILKQTLAKDFRSTVSDLKVIARSHELQNFVNQSSYPTKDIDNDFYNISLEKGLFDQIRYIDSDGMEKIRVNYNNGNPSIVAGQNLQNKRGRYYVDDTMKLDKNDIFISPLDLNIEKKQIEQPLKPMIRFGTPVFDNKDNKTGIIVLNYMAKPLLDLLESLTHNEMGHFALLNHSGYWLRGHEKKWEWAFMYENKRHISFATVYPAEWKRVLFNDSGQFQTENGMFTFTTFYPLTDRQISSTGSAKAIEPSKAHLRPNEFFFKIIKHIPTEELKVKQKEISYSIFNIFWIYFVVINIICFITAYLLEAKMRINRDRIVLIGKLQSALNEVKSLQGILPICSKCKKIRDDQGYWKQVDEYMSNHLDVDFSHGICDECAKELYSKEDWYQRVVDKIDKKRKDKNK